MTESDVSTEGFSSQSLSRRRMLKGAAAAGVGAVAWSAPNIKTLGFAPAYAQVCTVPAFLYEISARNTSCNCCANGTGASARYKEFGGACTGGSGPFPGTAVLRANSCAGATIDDNGSSAGNPNAGCPPTNCPSNPNGAAGVCLQATDPSLFCRVRIDVTAGNCPTRPEDGGNPADFIFTFTSVAAQGQQYFNLPRVQRGSVGNCAFFIQVSAECSTDPACVT